MARELTRPRFLLWRGICRRCGGVHCHRVFLRCRACVGGPQCCRVWTQLGRVGEILTLEELCP
jgi:hypothetical protein